MFFSKGDSFWWNVQYVCRRVINGHYYYWWKRGIRNVIRYIPVVWGDEDFDWTGLAGLMAYKFEKMADVHAHGHLVNAEKYERQLRVAAHCCRRMIADEYFEKAGYDPKTWSARVDAQMIAKRAGWAQRSDQMILGKLIGKHLQHWWD